MKTLLVFCDGTGMDGALAPPSSPNSVGGMLALAVEGGGKGNSQYSTNVLHLSRSVKDMDVNGNKQIVFYQSGVGSEADFAGDPVTGTTFLKAFGTAVASKIRDAYVFVSQNFEEGDEICLFGFSRGAYTARKLSGLIDQIGLLTRENLGHFFEIWRQLIDRKIPVIPPGTRRPCIKCVGVWDTVGSILDQVDALNITDTSLPKTVQVALHAVSLQENRRKFLPTLWTVPQGGLQPNQILKQIWFAGAHSDVGGGYERHELADISVYWMAGELKSLTNLGLDLEFLRLYEQLKPDPWGTSQPHNAYMELSVAMRLAIGHETRLESSQITQQSVFHESIKVSPQNLVSKDYMTTMTIIQEAFGPDFIPQYPPLNDFEKHCKEQWGHRGLNAPPPGGNDSPEIVVPPVVQWISGSREFVPPAAIEGGKQSGSTMYVGRAPYMDGLQPGELDGKTMRISYNGKDTVIEGGFEILVGRQSSVRWAEVSGNFWLAKLNGAIPVQGGYESDGTILYVAQALLGDSGTHCGNIKEGGHAHVTYGGDEESYNVLVFAPGV